MHGAFDEATQLGRELGGRGAGGWNRWETRSLTRGARVMFKRQFYPSLSSCPSLVPWLAPSSLPASATLSDPYVLGACLACH